MGFDCGEWVVLSGWGVRASLAAEHGLQSTGSVGVAPGSAALRHVESSWIRDEIHISCIGRWILNHWTTREPPGFHSSCFGHVQIFCNPADCSLPGASEGFSRQEYWSGLPFPPPGGLPDPGIEPASPALQVDSLLLNHQGSPLRFSYEY